MEAPQQQATDPEATANGGFLFGDPGGARQVLSREELLARLTALMRGFEGCENVTAIEVYRLEPADRRNGCNWSLAVMLEPAGVAPEVYALAYATVIAAARASWNLDDKENSGSEPQTC
jgi:hypothetical protein